MCTPEATSKKAGAPAKEEIKITPAMIEAGATVLAENYLSLEGGLSLFPLLAETIYRHMEEVRKTVR